MKSIQSMSQSSDTDQRPTDRGAIVVALWNRRMAASTKKAAAVRAVCAKLQCSKCGWYLYIAFAFTMHREYECTTRETETERD